MKREELLQAVEMLFYTDRILSMISLGRQRDEKSSALIAELERGDFYERLLALHSCAGSRDLAHVVRALADPSRHIRKLAMRLFPLDGSAQEVRLALANAPGHMQMPLLQRVRKHSRALLDTLLETLQPDHPQFCQALALGSPRLVQRNAATFQQHATLSDWKKLAQFHPELALDLLQAWADKATSEEKRLIGYVNTLLPLLSQQEPARAFLLVSTLKRWFSLAHINLSPLAQRLPEEVAEFMLAEIGPVQGDFSRAVKRLRTEQIIALCRDNRNLLEHSSGSWTDIHAPAWFFKLAPEQRLAVYSACREHLCFQGEYLPPQIVAALPEAQREKEAQWHSNHTGIPSSDRLLYASMLPWEEMLQATGGHLESTDTLLRSRALQARIGAIRYHPDGLPETMERLRAQKEQGNTRTALLEALLDLPASIWQERDLPDIKALLGPRWGKDDDDQQNELKLAWLVKLLPAHVDWAAWEFNVLLHDTGVTPHKRLIAALSEADAARLLTMLTNLMYVWAERGNAEGMAKTLTAFLTHKSAVMKFVPLLEKTLKDYVSPTFEGEPVLRLRCRLEPERRHTLIPELIRADPIWVSVPFVAEYLLRHRTDLLTPFLEYPSYAGGQVIWDDQSLFTLHKGWVAGTTTQQERLADSLMEVILRQKPMPADSLVASIHPQQPFDEQVAQAITSLALLPAISPDRLQSLTNDARPQVRAAAQRPLKSIDASPA